MTGPAFIIPCSGDLTRTPLIGQSTYRPGNEFKSRGLLTPVNPNSPFKADLAPSAYVVVVTRGHTHDFEALRALAARDLRYIGLIGSRAKVARIFDALQAEGMPIEGLARVHAPIGLDIGAVTPAEIAVSILAELIAVRHGRDASALSMQWKGRRTAKDTKEQDAESRKRQVQQQEAKETQ